jgi:methionyl aminopeptidase
MIFYKTNEEIELIRQSSLLVSKTLAHIASLIGPGVTGKFLDKEAETFIRDFGGVPAFKGYNGFPGTLCLSINEAVVHGIPTDEPFKDGDLVSADCGVVMNGYFGDSAYTFAIGVIPNEVSKLLQVTKECLQRAIEVSKVGNRIGDIGHAVQSHAENHGYGVVRDLTGHGLGKKLHEEPEVPNFGKRGSGPMIKPGLVIAIEPMINLGVKEVILLDDDWTIVTKDKKPSAHFEHTIAILSSGTQVLSDFEVIENALKKNANLVQHI